MAKNIQAQARGITLDWSRMLGFDQAVRVVDVKEGGETVALGARMGPKVGSKPDLGVRVASKVGSKPDLSVRVGSKIGSKA